MKLKIIAVGKIKEKYIKDGISEFAKRLTCYTSLSIVEISPVLIQDENLTDKVLTEEGEKILACIKPTDYVITLEIGGKELSSVDFAKAINDLTNDGTQEVVFVIGSSCGLGKNVSQRADFKLSLSKMTFLHEFARLLLVEQIYRAFKIIKGEKYHK